MRSSSRLSRPVWLFGIGKPLCVSSITWRAYCSWSSHLKRLDFAVPWRRATPRSAWSFITANMVWSSKYAVVTVSWEKWNKCYIWSESICLSIKFNCHYNYNQFTQILYRVSVLCKHYAHNVTFLRTHSVVIHHLWHWMAYNVLICR